MLSGVYAGVKQLDGLQTAHVYWSRTGDIAEKHMENG